MHWLIITENQDKAAQIREVLRQGIAASSDFGSTSVSSRGLPWTVEVEISPNNLCYKLKPKDSYKEILKKIDEISQEADRILLAFEPTNIGEATAWEFEKRLGSRRCARLRTYSLNEQALKQSIIQFESLDINGLPKANQQMAKAHWTQAVIDLTWASKINEWLSKITNYSAKATRLMGIILKTIANHQRKEKAHLSSSHWEIMLELKPSAKGIKDKVTQKDLTKAYIIVPTLKQIGNEVGPKAKEFWEQKLNQSREQSIKGWEVPQPEPGKPWRYHQQEEAKIQRQHIKKFPYFIVEGDSNSYITKSIQCPPTNNNIHETFGKKYKHEDIERILNVLYTKGLISNPKSNFQSLSATTISKMYHHCNHRFPNMTREPRVFHSEDDCPHKLEAIHPTNWDVSPKTLKENIHGIRNLNSQEFLLCQEVYERIYNWCVESQFEEEHGVQSRHFLSGPLFLSRKQANEREGKAFHIKKEEPFHAHMTVLAMSEGGNLPKKGSVMECLEVHIKEVKSVPPKPLSEESLLALLCKQNAGKRETICNILEFLRGDKLLQSPKELRLTNKGIEFLQLLEMNFGQYLDLNYLKTLNNNIKLVENGIKSDSDILNQWWYSLRSFLEVEREEPNYLQWSKKND
jgi:DNA topoisomerase IA